MHSRFTERINCSMNESELVDHIAQEFSPLAQINRQGSCLQLHSLSKNTHGSGFICDHTTISVSKADGGYIIDADIHVSPSKWFWIALVVGILFAWLCFFIPLGAFWYQRNMLHNTLSRTLRNIVVRHSSSGSVNQS